MHLWTEMSQTLLYWKPSTSAHWPLDLYTEQEEVWLSEISRLNREDREKVRPLIENGILPALEAEGPAPFLTLRK